MDVLEQLKSALASRYLIERQIGQGGMATVYLARDVRHDRRVALKVLNPELGAVVGMERFLAEIRVTANLQHPHLLPLFDSGQAEGQLFYVMPYVEGESLRDRIKREKQLPVDEALRLTAAVGSALDYAHRHGVIHRDLKPENILLQEGQPLVADFGIALAVSVAGGQRITQTGLSLGTPHYMSPEQATGDRVIDGRTDIYSLGAVLYEMLTGDPPHTGSTAQAIIAKVITDKPRSLRLGRESVPRHVEAAVECALAKLPADRFATAQDFVEALRGARPVTLPAGWATPASITTDPTIAAARRRARLRAALPWGVAVAALLGALAMSRKPPPRAQVSRFLLTLPDSARIRSPIGTTVAISPDGSRIAYTGGPEGGGQLYVRELDDLDSKPLRGTDRGSHPTFSPDGRSLLFVTDRWIKRVGVEGGTPINVAEDGIQPSWGPDGSVLFARRGSIYRTTPNGGTPVLIAKADSAKGIRTLTWPHMLPGGHAALLTITPTTVGTAGRVGVVTLDDGVVRNLEIEGANPRYIRTGHIVFGRQGNTVFGAPFDVKRLRTTGPAVPLLESVIVKPGGATELSVSDNGTMIYRNGSFSRYLVNVDERGGQQRVFDDPRAYTMPRISPDGKRIAVSVGGTGEAANNAASDTWVFDVRTATLTRLTQGGGERPEWMPDGKHILVVHLDPWNVSIQPWDGSDVPRLYAEGRTKPIMEIAVPRRGSGYLAARVAFGQQRDIWIAPVDSPRALKPFLATNADEYQPAVSADGKWLAYVSDESGRGEVYVRPMPGPGARIQISTDGGVEPAWSPTGKTVFYRAGGKFMSARITWQGDAASVTRQALFDDIFSSGGPSRANYSVAPDGKHFLFTRSTGSDSRNIVTLNWFEDVRERMNATRQR